MSANKILEEELTNLMSEVIDRQKMSGQYASGKTSDAYSIDVQEMAGKLLGASYVGVFTRGRKPGGVPKDFVDILKRWAQAKNITFTNEKQFNLWANAVKWKIIREGSKLYRSGNRNDIFETPLKEFSDRLQTRLSILYQQETANEIYKI